MVRKMVRCKTCVHLDEGWGCGWKCGHIHGAVNIKLEHIIGFNWEIGLHFHRWMRRSLCHGETGAWRYCDVYRKGRLPSRCHENIVYGIKRLCIDEPDGQWYDVQMESWMTEQWRRRGKA